MHRCNPSGISLLGSLTNELFKKPDRFVNACDNYYLSATFFWVHLLTVFRILLHEACSFVVLQLGTGAKSRDLLEVNINYKGVSWRYSIVKLWACVICDNRADVCRHSAAASVEITRWKTSQHYQVSLRSLINHPTSPFFFFFRNEMLIYF